jgi:gliding motility associated protien GldN
MKKLCYVLILVLFVTVVQAQESEIPIIKAEVSQTQTMFEKTVLRRMNLEQSQNMPFNSKNSEISRLIVQGVEDGYLKPYMTDSVLTIMPDSLFKSNVQIKQEGGDFGGGFGGGFGNEKAASGPTIDQIPRELFSVLYFKEDVVFDRNRSRLYWYIRTISLALPQSAGPIYNPKGFEIKVAHFKYDDVIDLFRGPYAKRAIWYNNQNQAQHRNFGDALELRLFNAPIVKVSNAENLDISQLESDPFKRVLMQQKMEHDLMEYESELWEY